MRALLFLLLSASVFAQLPKPGSNGGGGGGGTGGAFSALTGVPNVVRTTSTRLTLFSQCVASPGCNVGFGNTGYNIAASYTADITSTSAAGTARIYIASDGTPTLGYDSNIVMGTCSAGLTCTSGVTAFPATAIRLYAWTAGSTANTWDSSGGTNWVAAVSTKTVSCTGAGCTQTDVNGNTNFDIPGGTGTVTPSSVDTFTNKTFGQSIVFSADGFNLASSGHYADNVYAIQGNLFQVFAKSYQIYGNAPSISGCSNGTIVGGSTAGSFLSGTTGTCTVTITMGGSQVAVNQFACSASNVTTPANLVTMTASTTSTVTFSGVTTSGDKIVWMCVGF